MPQDTGSLRRGLPAPDGLNYLLVEVLAIGLGLALISAVL
jgi:hypothetical protein